MESAADSTTNIVHVSDCVSRRAYTSISESGFDLDKRYTVNNHGSEISVAYSYSITLCSLSLISSVVSIAALLA